MSNPIEVQFSGTDLAGTIENLAIFETDPAHETNVIGPNEAWGVRLQWETSGFTSQNPILAAVTEWHLQMHMEIMGPGADQTLPAAPVVVAYNTGTQVGSDAVNFNGTINVPAGGVPTGLYKLTCVLQLFTVPAAGGIPLPALGFVEGPLVQIF